MPDIEKVIKGLEPLTRPAFARDLPCSQQLIRDALALLKEREPITGETSDGYHTFNELYHHRAVLFSVIVANYHECTWKSKKHADGNMYDGMFIVGIDTPDGQATYHYDIDPYWDMFNCRVLDSAPEWDGHTPAQAIERIGKLPAVDAVEVKHGQWHGVNADKEGWTRTDGTPVFLMCSECQNIVINNGSAKWHYCPNCGAKMDGGEKDD